LIQLYFNCAQFCSSHFRSYSSPFCDLGSDLSTHFIHGSTLSPFDTIQYLRITLYMSVLYLRITFYMSVRYLRITPSLLYWMYSSYSIDNNVGINIKLMDFLDFCNTCVKKFASRRNLLKHNLKVPRW